MLLAGAIFVLTIVLVIWQPKGLGIGWSATLGAGLALISGVVHVGDIPGVEYRLERDGDLYCRDYYQPAAR
jgi:arsenical pump membrane protein